MLTLYKRSSLIPNIPERSTVTNKRPTAKPNNLNNVPTTLKVLKPTAFKATIPPGALKASNTPAPPPTTSSTRRPQPSAYTRPYPVPPVSTLYTASLAAVAPTVAYTRPNAAAGAASALTTTRREFLQKQRRKPYTVRKPATSAVPKGRVLNLAAANSREDVGEEDDSDYYDTATTTTGGLRPVTPSSVPKTNSTKVRTDEFYSPFTNY